MGTENVEMPKTTVQKPDCAVSNSTACQRLSELFASGPCSSLASTPLMEMHFKRHTYQHWGLWTPLYYKSRPSSLISHSIFTGRRLTECWDANATQRLAKDVHLRSPNHPRSSTYSSRQMLVSLTNLHIRNRAWCAAHGQALLWVSIQL
jgi:hypothetical protein